MNLHIRSILCQRISSFSVLHGMVLCLSFAVSILLWMVLVWTDLIPPPTPLNEKRSSVDAVINLSEMTSFPCIVGIGKNGCNTVRLFNADGSLWTEFAWRNDEMSDYVNWSEIQPFAYSPSFGLLVFRAVSRSGTWIEIVANEADGTRKFIRTSGWGIKVEDWSTHILNRDSIDASRQPVLDSPNGMKLGQFAYADVHLRPIRVDGEWLMVRLTQRDPFSKERLAYRTGEDVSSRPFVWVKWRDGHKILIDLFYFA